ncbi:hypothetical protein CL619_02600 [archaeon]|nr:hypothetical protein [archaeon]|tara:strand:+ start:5087 stop:5338 length:252 start_codon:yes stop_codon:yes gene_type:complete
MGITEAALPKILEISCDYCHINLEGKDGWECHFEADQQYSIKKCGCGKRKWVSVKLDGFDPRNFFEKQSKEVESNFPKGFEKE